MTLFISPPFGNYIDLPYTKSIIGSFTLKNRPGLFSQIYKTLHYSHKYGGWVNKIGLRNPGIDWAISKYNDKSIFNFYKSNIISISILDVSEIDKLVEKIPNDMNIELNISCPNVRYTTDTNTDKKTIESELYKFIDKNREWCCVKLSCNTNLSTIDNLYKQGFRKFHCCNTLPVSIGGVSGPILIPYTTKLIQNIKSKYPDCEVVAGGGIRDIETLKYYKKLGADHFSISTLLFNPMLFIIFYFKYLKYNKYTK